MRLEFQGIGIPKFSPNSDESVEFPGSSESSGRVNLLGPSEQKGLY